jgi:broad specificity phosphatase PhoE
MEDKQKLIFLIRHGNTEFNEKKTFRGHFDVPLDSKGLKQAEKTGQFLKDIHLEVIYSSPLSRALKTAETIKKYQEPSTEIIEDDCFTDLSFGQWEGMTYEDAERKYPEIFLKWTREPFKVRIPGGGTLSGVQEKAWRALKDIVTQSPYSNIGIVAHRIVNKLLISKMLDIKESGIWKIIQNPCCINIFEYRYGIFFVSKLNYDSHITDIKESFFKQD